MIKLSFLCVYTALTNLFAIYFRLLEIEVNTLKRGDSQFEAFLDQHRSKIERQLLRLKHLKVFYYVL